MSHFGKLIAAVQLFALICGVPIEEGEDVGSVRVQNGKLVVSSHNSFPYMAHIKVIISHNGKQTVSQVCGGVIIGKRTILTAAHCVHEMENSHVVVQVGIIDTKVEKQGGQNIIVKDRLIHESFQKRCRLNGRYCFNLHDIAILWLEFDLKLGPKVAIALLSRAPSKPFGKEGWILGWGETKEIKVPSMLQRGRVRVMTDAECKAYNPSALKIDSTICLTSARGKTRSADGDSGGPFVINGVVYGISSTSVFQDEHLRDWIDLYTYVPLYVDWIQKNQLAGPPRTRTPTSNPNEFRKPSRTQN